MPAPGDQHRDTPATVNPFVPVVPRMSEWTAREIATLQSRLDKQLGPEYISTRPGAGGGKVHYLAAEKVINLANEVFGFNGWSSSIQNVQIDFVDENTTNGKITLGLSTIVRVTLKDGTFHEDTGYGHIENCKGKAAAFEKAKKEAATDALKRALRNFGNVLGNCLYDKDYLQKVTKLKIAPCRWDAQNLHRHPDFAPVKPTAIGDDDENVPQQGNHGNANGTAQDVKRMSSVQSGTSFGSAELEDDFGADVFGDTDFTHPDEVRLDDSTTMQSPAQRQMIGQRNDISRMHSMPHLRPPNLQQPQAPQGMQAPQNPHGIQRPSNGPAQAQPSRMLPPQTPGHQPRQAPVAQSNGDATRSNSSSAEDAQQHRPNGGHQIKPANGSTEAYQPPMPQEPPPHAPGGFVTGRAAELINQNSDVKAPGTVTPFNPHAESPSIRRTHGVNPGKSAPIMRQSLGSVAPAQNAHVGQAAGGHAPPQQQQTNTNGFSAPGPARANFVNPSADPNRRIGMPQAGGMNRGAYKPHTSLKRPALTDVSNIPQMDGGGDAKKQRVETGGQIDAPNGDVAS